MGQPELGVVYGGTAQCGCCEHYQRYDWHSRLGQCDASQPRLPGGLWDTDWRQCETFEEEAPAPGIKEA